MAEFTHKSWDNGWSNSVEKFKTLRTNRAVANRTFFQQRSILMIEYLFDDGSFVVLPMEVIEKLGISNGINENEERNLS